MSNHLNLQLCPDCYYQQPEYFFYCVKCGHQFASQCAHCQQPLLDNFVFCAFCGNLTDHEGNIPLPPPLQAKPIAPPEKKSPVPVTTTESAERRQAVILFSDICGFTSMSENMDPEEVVDIVKPLFNKIGDAIKKYGGFIDKFLGDAVMALFGVPTSHEDDAERALLAALEMRDLTRKYSQEIQKTRGINLEMRTGLQIGLVVTGNVVAGMQKSYTVIGDAVNTAARLEQNAEPGEIRVTEQIYNLTQYSFNFEARDAIKVKGKKEALNTYCLMGIKEHEQRNRGFEHRQISFVGRESELSDLTQLAHEALNEKYKFVTLCGLGGIGKSRLSREVYHRVSPDSKVVYLHASSTSYSKNFSYFLLQNLLKNILNININSDRSVVLHHIKSWLENIKIEPSDLTVNLLEYLVFLSSDANDLKQLSPDHLKKQIFKTLADCLTAQVMVNPTFISLDDLQWADRISLEWLQYYEDYLKHVNQNVTVFICTTNRTGSIDQSIKELVSWDKVVTLDPFSRLEAKNFINSILSLEETPQELVELYEALLQRAQGNPFYLEETLKTLFNEELLVYQNQRWKLTCPIKKLPLPDSIQNLVISRFDKFDHEIKSLLQVASVIGKQFSYELLEYLYERKQGAQSLDDCLNLLESEGFFVIIEYSGEKEIRFQQSLSQETIYYTLLHKRKEALHKKIAAALEEIHPTSMLIDIAEILAFHYSQTDEHFQATKYLYLAARKVEKLYANHEALDYYNQTLELLKHLPSSTFLPVDFQNEEWLKSSSLIELITEKQTDIYFLVGEYEKVLESCEKQLRTSQNNYTQARYYLKWGKVLAKRSDFKGALEQYKKGQDILIENAISLEMAQLLNASGWAFCWTGEYSQAIKACHKSLDILEQKSNIQEIAYANNVLGVIHFYLYDWDKALEYYHQSLEIQKKIFDRWGMANSLNNIGNIYTMLFDWPKALDYYSQSLNLREMLANRAGVGTSCNNLGHIYTELGQYEEASKYLQRSHKILTELQNELEGAISIGNMGIVLKKQKQYDAAIMNLVESLAILKRLKAEEVMPSFLNSLIEVHLDTGELELAKKALEEGDKLLEKKGEPLQKGRFSRLKALYFVMKEDYDQARIFLDKALELLEPVNYPLEHLLLYQQMSEFYLILKIQSRADEWQMRFKTALAKAEPIYQVQFKHLIEA